jgi:hypothetical protein
MRYFIKKNRVEPVSFVLDDTTFNIEQVLEEVQSDTLRRSGSGIRYKVRAVSENMKIEAFLYRVSDLWYFAARRDNMPDVQTRHTGDNFSGKKIIDSRYDNPYKAAVDVAAVFHGYGYVEPCAVIWDDDRKFDIDRVLENERAASLKAGIIGTLYKIRVRDKETYLFRDDDLWFMERKGSYKVLDVHGRPVY